jgi:hypothetical protein
MSAISKPARFTVYTGALILAAVSCLLQMPVTIRFLGFDNDYTTHIKFAETIYRTHHIVVPHFLFHFLTIAVFEVARTSFQTAALVVLGFCYALTGWLVYREVATPIMEASSTAPLWRSVAAGFLAIAVLLFEPILRPNVPHIYQIGYLWAEPYENPTYSVMKPFTLVSTASALVFLRSMTASRFAVLLAALATILGALAKPSFVICLMPAVVAVAVWRWKHQQAVNWTAVVLGILLPGALVVLLQYYLSYSGLGPQETYHNAIIFAPLGVFRIRHITYLPMKFALSVAFPAAIYLLYWKSARRDLSLNFALLLFTLGLGCAIFLAEKQRMEHGNLLWGAYITLFILYLYSTLFLVRQLTKTSWRPGMTARHVVAIGIFLAHLTSGILVYIATLHQSMG